MHSASFRAVLLALRAVMHLVGQVDSCVLLWPDTWTPWCEYLRGKQPVMKTLVPVLRRAAVEDT